MEGIGTYYVHGEETKKEVATWKKRKARTGREITQRPKYRFFMDGRSILPKRDRELVAFFAERRQRIIISRKSVEPLAILTTEKCFVDLVWWIQVGV
jgi:hypothetical protein